MYSYTRIIPITGFLILTGCGGSSSSPSITADNVQSLSIAATEGASQSISSNKANLFNYKTSSDVSTSQAVDDFNKSLTENIYSPAFACINSPTGQFTDNFGTGPTGSYDFVQCEVTTGIVINGSVVISGSQSAFSLSYNNFTVKIGDNPAQEIDLSIDCEITNNTTSCTKSSSVLGIDNRTYTISNLSVSGDEVNGYNVTATVTDPDHGKIDINASDMYFNCSSPYEDRPSSGQITFSAGGKSATVVYNSCNSYTVTLDGVANIYSWL